MTPLTDRTVANLKPKGARYQVFDGGCPGLSIRVSPSGGKSWVWQYREHVATDSGFEPGKRTRFWTLGSYPAVTLKKARTITDKARSLLKNRGVDPAVGKREARHAESFGELAADYIERHAKPRKKSWKEDQRQLTANVLPFWKSRHVKAITRKDVHELLDRIADRGKPVTYNRVKALVSRIFKHGIDRAWLDHNPAAGISKQPEMSRERVLSDEELTGLWRALEAIRTGNQPTPPISPMLARGLQTMLRTAQRGTEIFTMEWSDVDEASGWWTIPGTKTKNGKEHRVPLTQAALALIAEARANGSRWVFAGLQGGTLQDKAKKAVSRLRHAGLLTGDYTRHDLRRTVATGMTMRGIARATVAQVLNQQEGGPRATEVYDRYNYDREKREALEAWGRHLDALLTGRPSRVVPFAGKRR